MEGWGRGEVVKKVEEWQPGRQAVSPEMVCPMEGAGSVIPEPEALPSGTETDEFISVGRDSEYGTGPASPIVLSEVGDGLRLRGGMRVWRG